MTTGVPFTLDIHLEAAGRRDRLAEELWRGLAVPPRTIQPKHLYDPAGCALYEQITELEEYYQARTEMQILDREVDGIMSRHRPIELVELGSGSSRKTRALLDAMHRNGDRYRYVPFDVSADALRDAAGALSEAYPELEIHAIAGDFEHHLQEVPRSSPARCGWWRSWGARSATSHRTGAGSSCGMSGPLLGPDDVLLMGVDLDRDPERTRRAYDDAAGITAEFNRNVLRVVNRELDADFVPEDFAHRAVWREDERRVEMRLRATRPMRVRLGQPGAEIEIAEGEEILTEICCKFNEPYLGRVYADAGLELLEWHTDPAARFAVTLARRPQPTA